jgi:peptidoglycan/LPS O-acetylase OafA/YrhL
MNKNNNFDFLRFLFALLVAVFHSYPLAGGNESSQWICQITNGQIVLAQIGLSGVFIVSGFFIFQRVQRSKGVWIISKAFFKTFSNIVRFIIDYKYCCSFGL